MKTEEKSFNDLVREAINKMRYPEAESKKTKAIDKSANIVDEWRNPQENTRQIKRSY